MARRALGPASLAVVQAVDRLGPAPFLVACSGGPDSLALAAAATVVAVRREVGVRAVVVDHGLQRGSDQVAVDVVAQLHEKLAIPAQVVTVQVGRAGAGPEADARHARYQALSQAADPAEQILLGHTLDDQAETVLLGLARGSGIRSLAGMPAQRGRFVRPLLGLRRSLTAEACREFGLKPWLDPHNADPRFARVRVRTAALPTLEQELGPGITEALARSAALARADADYLDDVATTAAAGLAGPGLEADAVAKLPGPIATRVLQAWLRDSGADDLTAAHVQAVWALVADWHGQVGVDLPGVRVSRVNGRLRADRL